MGGYNFIDHLHLQPSKLINSLRCIESWYNDVPYHNNIHVLDVLHTVNVMLPHDNTIHFSFLDNITSLDVYSILLSAIIHDISHEGLNNLYYQNNPLAFHDELTLEPFHDVFGRRLLQRHGAFEGLSDEEQKYSEEVISSAVIGTTMANHFDLFTLLQNEVQSAFSDEDGAATSEDGMDTRYNKTAFLSFLVHAADISSPTKPFPMFSQWIPRVFTEFFRQGDLEGKQGHPISPLCNRRELTEQTIAESQVMFINTFVKPMYELIGKICTWIKEDVVPLLDANLNAMTSWVDELKVKEKREATK
ncbi:3',5'-cyclic nucleotide phosphodiesterase [Thalassiosira pseudonana CCMP1335]